MNYIHKPFFTEATYVHWLGEETLVSRLAKNFKAVGISVDPAGKEEDDRKNPSFGVQQDECPLAVPAHKHPVRRKSRILDQIYHVKLTGKEASHATEAQTCNEESNRLIKIEPATGELVGREEQKKTVVENFKESLSNSSAQIDIPSSDKVFGKYVEQGRFRTMLSEDSSITTIMDEPASTRSAPEFKSYQSSLVPPLRDELINDSQSKHKQEGPEVVNQSVHRPFLNKDNQGNLVIIKKGGQDFTSIDDQACPVKVQDNKVFAIEGREERNSDKADVTKVKTFALGTFYHRTETIMDSNPQTDSVPKVQGLMKSTPILNVQQSQQIYTETHTVTQHQNCVTNTCNNTGCDKRKREVDRSSTVYSKKNRTVYEAELFKKRPKRMSSLNKQEQMIYLELSTKFGHNMPKSLTRVHSQEFKQFQHLQRQVKKEQKNYMSYLKYISRSCINDYLYIHPEAHKYVEAKFLGMQKRLLTYPRFYEQIDEILLPDCAPQPALVMQYVRPLLQMGSVEKLVLPELLPGMPQPCLPLSYSTVNTVCPSVRPTITGPYVWNHEAISCDVNAEQLAVPNRCAVVMTASTIKHLIDNQDRPSYWQIPVTVREYVITDGGKASNHKVVYIDKPFKSSTYHTGRDKNKIFQTCALRAISSRPKQRMKVFSNIRSVITDEQKPSMADIEMTLEKTKTMVAKDRELLQQNSVRSDEEDDDGDEKCRQRRREHGRKRINRPQKQKGERKGKVKEEVSRKSGLGLFDAELNIDDLETFGTDVSWKLQLKQQNMSPKESGNLLREASHLPSDIQMTSTSHKQEKFVRERRFTEHVEQSSSACTGQLVCSSWQRIESVPQTYVITEGETLKDQTFTQSAELNSLVDKQKQSTQNIVQLELFREKHNQTEGMDTLQMPTGNTEHVSCLKHGLGLSLSEKMKQMSNIKKKLRLRSTSTEKLLPVTPVAYLASGVKGEDTDEGSDADSETGLVIDAPDDNEPESDANEDNKIGLDIGKHSDLHTDKMAEHLNPNSAEIEATLHGYESEGSKLSNSTNEAGSEIKPVASCNSLFKAECMDTDMDKEGIQTGAAILEVKLICISKEITPEDKELETSIDGSFSNKPARQRLRSAASCESAVLLLDPNNDQIEKGVNQMTGQLSGDKDRIQIIASVTRAQKRRSVESKETASPAKRSLRSRLGSSEMTKNSCDDGVIVGATKWCKVNIANGTSDGDPVALQPDVDAEPSQIVTRSGRKVDKVTQRRSRSSSSITGCKGSPDACSTKRQIQTSVETNTLCIGMQEAHKASQLKLEVPTSDVLQLVTTPRRRGRPPKQKKLNQEIEMKKIDELAKAMKEKLAQRIKTDHQGVADLEARRQSQRDLYAHHSCGNDNCGVENYQDIVKISKPTVSSEKIHTRVAAPNTVVSPTLPIRPCEDSSSVDSILTMQSEMFKPPVNTTTTQGSFAVQHNMSQVKFPTEGNVVYHEWSLDGISIIIRCSYHGCLNPQGLVHLTTKMEYQPCFGFENLTVSEIAQDWMSVYVRPNSSLIRARVNPYNSEVMMMEHIQYPDLIPADSNFSPAQAFTDLSHILGRLKKLEAGQFLLKNNPKQDSLSILKVSDTKTLGQHDLYYEILCRQKKPQQTADWLPVDTTLLLPHHRKMGLVPCTYIPKDGPYKQQKQQPKPSKKKKRKKGHT